MAGSDESGDERRRGERIPINDEFAAGLATGPGTSWVSDLSHGGVFVHTEELLPVGSMIELRFTVLVEDPVVIEAIAKVVRHSRKPRGMGVEFATLAPGMTERIEHVLERRRPLDSGAPLRLPEPSRDYASANRIMFARPAPVEGLELRASRTRKREPDLDDAVTASFPRVEPAAGASKIKFKPPTLPSSSAAPAKPASDDDRTGQYRALRRDDD